MSLSIEDALSRGFSRTVARNGLLLVAVTYVLNLVSGLVGPANVGSYLPPGAPIPAQAAQPVIGVPLVVDSLLSLLTAVATAFVTLAALRIFTGEETEELPTEAFTRNGFWAFVNLVVGVIVFGIVVFIGFLLFVLPGIFLLTTLFYWPVFVAVEDENFAEALQSSWELTKGHRLRVFLLGVAFVLVGLVVSVAFGLPAAFLGPLGVFVTAIGAAVTSIFGDAVLASAYLQLEAEDDEPAAEPVAVEA